ncbi:hypothetical protein PCASD_05179 [Puccinia coronata f. sp. avenae]|uniref:Arf-GAP domain-containing protein n=1 Tax=Puccinia coronata f. sp. avenae TaxID=200324 RepID=A0A2N5V3K4_9BASI|nr:hypothetical protein PCASD_05179 [Puccinia coronata f. sp. avenae]
MEEYSTSTRATTAYQQRLNGEEKQQERRTASSDGQEEEEEEQQPEEEDELVILSERIALESQTQTQTQTHSTTTTTSSKRLQLSSLYSQSKHRLHALLPKNQQPQYMTTTSLHADSPTSNSYNTHLLLPAALSSSAFPSSSATDPIIPDAQLEDGPLLRAQLGGLEHRASQLKKSIKPLIKVFEQIHDNLCASLESDARLHQALENLDETTPACFRPLREIYHKYAKIQNRVIDEERKERVETKVLHPLRCMANNLKAMNNRKKSFLQQAKLYDEALQKYLAMKSEGEVELRKMEQMKAKVEFARVEYHHWIYEQAVFQEVEVLELLTEYMAAEDACRRSPSLETYMINNELANLRQELATRHVERETQRRAMLLHRQAWRNKLDNFLQTSPRLFDSASHSRNISGTPPRAKPLARSSYTPDLLHAHPSLNRTQELGGKLRGFAMTLTAKAFGGEEGGISSTRAQANLTIPESLPMAVSDSAESDTVPDLSSTKRIRSWSTNVQRKKEGFLLSCTKSIAAGGPQRHHNPTEQAQGTGGIPNGDAVRSWKKLWCVLAGGELREYKGDELVEPHRTGIDLRYAMVRPRKGKVERKFSFEVVTTQFVRVYQAFSSVEMDEWVAAIEASIESVLNSSSSAKPTKHKFGDQQARIATLTIPKPKLGLISGRGKGQSAGNNDHHGDDCTTVVVSSNNNSSKQKASALEHHQEGSLQVEWKPFKDRMRNPSLQNPLSPADRPHFSNQLERSFTVKDDGSGSRPHNPRLHDQSTMFEDKLAPLAMSIRSDEYPWIREGLIEATEGGGEGSSASHAREEEDDDDDDDDDDDEEKRMEAIHERNWNELDILSKRSVCAECGSPHPRWASYSLGILICIKCCGIHRGLGTHISKVRSLDLDEWNDDQMRAIREIGNAQSKAIWEARLPADFQVTPAFVPLSLSNNLGSSFGSRNPDAFLLVMTRLSSGLSNVKQLVHDKYLHKKYIKD